jgi:hypothetical protein
MYVYTYTYIYINIGYGEKVCIFLTHQTKRVLITAKHVYLLFILIHRNTYTYVFKYVPCIKAVGKISDRSLGETPDI